MTKQRQHERAEREPEIKTVVAPRIEIVLYQGADIKSGDEYGAALVLHIPDGGAPTVTKLEGGRFDKSAAALFISAIYTHIGMKFGTEESKRGAQDFNN
jgi:hypothetical protein